jgi:hypothetical protein
MEPFDVAVALGMVIGRAPMGDAEPIQSLNITGRRKLRAVVIVKVKPIPRGSKGKPPARRGSAPPYLDLAMRGANARIVATPEKTGQALKHAAFPRARPSLGHFTDDSVAEGPSQAHNGSHLDSVKMEHIVQALLIQSDTHPRT